MSLNSSDISAIIRLRRAGHFTKNSSIVQLGDNRFNDDLLRDSAVLDDICQAFGVSCRDFSVPLSDAFTEANRDVANGTAPPLSDLWEWLGFRCARIDVDTNAGAIPLDLNFDQTPEHIRGEFSLIMNIGFTSHFANQINAFKIVHDLCQRGGIMIHRLPAEGLFTHGLVKYDPKFFWMLSRSNGYKWLDFDLRISESRIGIGSDVISELRKFQGGADSPVDSYRVADGTLFVILQKLYDMDFVPPLDVPNGARVSRQFAENYWTVFEPQRFQEMIQREEDAKSGQGAPENAINSADGLLQKPSTS